MKNWRVYLIRKRSNGDVVRPVSDEAGSEQSATLAEAAGQHFRVAKEELDSQVGAEDTPPEETTLRLYLFEVSQQAVVPAILQRIHDHNVKLLILHRHASTRSTAEDFVVQRQLFRDASCEVMQLRPGRQDPQSQPSILVPCGGGPDSRLTLQLAIDMAQTHEGRIVALYVEPEVDEVASLVGRRILDRMVDPAAGKKRDVRIERRVVLCDEIALGIVQEAERGYDLVLMGAHYHGRVHRLLFRGTSERVIANEQSTCVAVVRTPIPWKHRLWRRLDHAFSGTVPQLTREQRVSLVERVQSSSQWDFDFIALIPCLSTLIAGLGLIQNASAVVIGAMLVAPLMTPLLGAGLALAQGKSGSLAKCRSHGCPRLFTRVLHRSALGLGITARHASS